MILTDAAIETTLIYEMGVRTDPHLEASRLVETEAGREALRTLYTSFLEVGRRYNLRMQVATPTFRADPGRAQAAGADFRRINGDCVRLLRELIGAQDVVLTGVLGPCHDAYHPEQALDAESSYRYHTAQAEALAEAGAQFLFAPTFPSVPESVGVVRAMSATGLPCAVGWVLGGDTRLLDGSSLESAVAQVDAVCAPQHYMLSCIHPTLADRALAANPGAHGRVLGLKANTSRRATSELVALGRLESEDPEQYARELLEVGERYGLEILGGCCGSNATHLEALARLWTQRP